MTHNPLNDTLKVISKYILNMDDKHTAIIIKLILENLMLSAQIELLRDINEEK